MLTRDVERNEVLKSSDVITERRPKAEVGSDAAARDHAVGMQMRRQLRAGQALAGRRSRQARSGAARRQRHPDLRIRRPLSHHPRQGARQRHRRRLVSVLNLQSKRTVSGVVIGRGQVAIAVATPRLPASRQTHPPRSGRPNSRAGFGRRQQQFASRSKSRVTFMYTSSINRIALTGTLLTIVSVARRLFVDRPAVADRRAAETVGDRKSDGAARLQAGADADAETGSGVLQRQFAVAERLALVLQGPARAPDRRPPDRHRQHHRPGQFRQRDPAQPHRHRRFRHHRFPRQQPADRQATSCCPDAC